MVQYNPLQYLPSAEDLPDSDDTPVDNELQHLIPTLLRAILALLWAERMDWFLGVNMALYYDREKSAIVPDGFLSVGVPRYRESGKLRLSYAIWLENGIVPQLTLEVVSKSPGEEYDDKKTKYAQMGVLYYVIYNPDYYRRDKHDPFEVYRLENKVYVRQQGSPVWMPELNLGIGREIGTHEGCTREWLYWYDQQGNRYPAPENVIGIERQRAEIERQRAEIERQRAEAALQQLVIEQQRAEIERQRALAAQAQLEELLARLRDRGIDPNSL